MFTKEFVPDVCTGTEAEPATHTGSITIRMPSFVEREQMFEKARSAKGTSRLMQIAVRVKSGEITEEQGAKELTDAGEVDAGSSFMASMIGFLPLYIVKIDLTRIKDGYKYKNFEEISYTSCLHQTCNDLVSQLVSDFEVGAEGPESQRS